MDKEFFETGWVHYFYYYSLTVILGRISFFKVRDIAGSKKDVRHNQLVGPDSTLHFNFRLSRYGVSGIIECGPCPVGAFFSVDAVCVDGADNVDGD